MWAWRHSGAEHRLTHFYQNTWTLWEISFDLSTDQKQLQAMQQFSFRSPVIITTKWNHAALHKSMCENQDLRPSPLGIIPIAVMWGTAWYDLGLLPIKATIFWNELKEILRLLMKLFGGIIWTAALFPHKCSLVLRGSLFCSRTRQESSMHTLKTIVQLLQDISYKNTFFLKLWHAFYPHPHLITPLRQWELQ